MKLTEVDGQLTAHKTSGDVIHWLDDWSEFQVSEHIANELRKSSHLLDENYWYLVIGSYQEREEGQEPTEFDWEISIQGVSVQTPLRGKVEFIEDLPTLF